MTQRLYRNRFFRLVYLIPIVALSLTACGQSVKDGNSVEGADFTYPITITYNGKPLYCIEQGHGLSCDFVRYHMENPK